MCNSHHAKGPTLGNDETSDFSIPSETHRESPVVTRGDSWVTSDRDEMRPLWDWLNPGFLANSRRIVAPDIPHALDECAGGVFPELIIVLQSWPIEYSSDEIRRLLAFAPLARIVVCYGAWCESDGRNHSLWPQTVRVPLWAAQSRIEREWRLLQNPGDQQPLPWSASRDETFAADHPSIAKVAQALSFLVDSPDAAYRQSVTEIMGEAGHKPVQDQPAVLLIDVDPWGPLRSAVLQELIARFPGATVVAIVNLASPSLIDELRNLGVKVISPKLGFRPPLR